MPGLTLSHIPIRYKGEKAPVISVRVQELFSVWRSIPAIDCRIVSLVVELLSPAWHPIQITADLPGFWRESWKDVLPDICGRYPRHVWPDDSLAPDPARRAKPRKG